MPARTKRVQHWLDVGTCRSCIRTALLAVAVTALVLTGCASGPVVPADSPTLPARGFFMGLLPRLRMASPLPKPMKRHLASPSLFQCGDVRRLSISGTGAVGQLGKTFVEQYTRGNGMFPLVHMSFIGTNVTLVVPPGMSALP